MHFSWPTPTTSSKWRKSIKTQWSLNSSRRSYPTSSSASAPVTWHRKKNQPLPSGKRGRLKNRRVKWRCMFKSNPILFRLCSRMNLCICLGANWLMCWIPPITLISYSSSQRSVKLGWPSGKINKISILRILFAEKLLELSSLSSIKSLKNSVNSSPIRQVSFSTCYR